ncbi:MAG: hypothetical protein U0M00_01750 [Clostridia bacterium]|nr:hypothetical protein [Clostridia bacterium]
MKENSREEDIALIEKSLCDKDTIIQYHYWVGTDFLNAVERIVADYKRVLKENEELKEDRDKFKKALGRRITYCNELEKDLFENSSNYVIKKQKVKDKIEELKKKVEELTDEKGYWGGSDLLEQIKVLQELLEKEK